jgi:hypothetical protein
MTSRSGVRDSLAWLEKAANSWAAASEAGGVAFAGYYKTIINMHGYNCRKGASLSFLL